MLFLTREAGQSVMVGDDVRVQITIITLSYVGLCITDLEKQQWVTLPVGHKHNITKDVWVKLRAIDDTRSPRQVRLGFEAPNDVIIHRTEIYKIRQEQKEHDDTRLTSH